MTDDSSVMAAGTWDDFTYIFEAVGNQYSLIQTMSSSDDLDGVDITGDGEFLATCIYTTSAHVLQKQVDGTYSEIQSFVSGSGRYKAVAISEDGELMFYGTSTDVYVVKKSGGTYSALTTLTGFP